MKSHCGNVEIISDDWSDCLMLSEVFDEVVTLVFKGVFHPYLKKVSIYAVNTLEEARAVIKSDGFFILMTNNIQDIFCQMYAILDVERKMVGNGPFRD